MLQQMDVRIGEEGNGQGQRAKIRVRDDRAPVLLAAIIKRAAWDANHRNDLDAAKFVWSVAPHAAPRLLNCDARDEEGENDRDRTPAKQ